MTTELTTEVPTLAEIIAAHPDFRIVVLGRHLPQTSRPGQLPTDWYPEAPLKPEAVDIALRIRTAYLEGVTFVMGGHSPLIRTKQTIAYLAPYLPVDSVKEFPELGPNNFDDWNFLADMKGGTTAADCFAAAPDLLDREGFKVFQVVCDVASSIEDGQVALLESHSPLVESAAGAAYYRWPPEYDCGKGDLLVFVMMNNMNAENDVPVALYHLPVPPAQES